MLGDRREAFYDSLLDELGPHYANYDELSMRVGLDLTFTCDVIQQLTSVQFACYGLSKSTFNILMLLRHGPPDGMQLHELGELLLVSRANVTGLMDHLEQKELVTRTVAETDRRARCAKITTGGVALLEKLVPAHNKTVSLLLQEMSAEEKRTLRKLLKRVRESLAVGGQMCKAAVPAKIKSEKD